MRVLRTTPVAEMLHVHSIPSNKDRAKVKRDEPEQKKHRVATSHDKYHNQGGKEKCYDWYHNKGGKEKMRHIYWDLGGREKYHDFYYNKGGKEMCAAYYLDKTKPEREAATHARNLRHGLPENVSTPNLHQMQYWW